MKFGLGIILVMAFTFVGHLFLPWYCPAIVGALVGIGLGNKPAAGFALGTTAVFTLWTTWAYAFDIPNGGQLSTQMAELIPFVSSGFQLNMLAATLGGLLGGFGTMTGCLLRQIITGEGNDDNKRSSAQRKRKKRKGGNRKRLALR